MLGGTVRLMQRARAFGWHAIQVDGTDVDAVNGALASGHFRKARVYHCKNQGARCFVPGG